MTAFFYHIIPLLRVLGYFSAFSSGSARSLMSSKTVIFKIWPNYFIKLTHTKLAAFGSLTACFVIFCPFYVYIYMHVKPDNLVVLFLYHSGIYIYIYIYILYIYILYVYIYIYIYFLWGGGGQGGVISSPF